VVEHELAEGGDGDGEGVSRNEAGAAVHREHEVVDALTDLGAGHPGGERGQRGVVDGGDAGEGHGVVAQVVDGLADVLLVFWVEEGGEGRVEVGVAVHGWDRATERECDRATEGRR
jgi:hypothetical protein